MTEPYFLWDYDFTEKDLQKILREGDESEKRWLIARILEHAHFSDVFHYLSLEEILRFFPKLKLRPVTRRYWQRALSAWDYHVKA